MNYTVYAIRSGNRIYIGQTGNLSDRINQHNAGLVFSTKRAKAWTLVATEKFETRAQARWFERQLKHSRGRRRRWVQQHAIT
jgi:putative endonuclease